MLPYLAGDLGKVSESAPEGHIERQSPAAHSDNRDESNPQLEDILDEILDDSPNTTSGTSATPRDITSDENSTDNLETALKPSDRQQNSTGSSNDTIYGAEECSRARNFGSKPTQISSLLVNATVQELEKGLEKGIHLAENLDVAFSQSLSAIKGISELRLATQGIKKQKLRTKVIIGVIGQTGAGKSSIINALLDEERLVPTNCMRACTAVATEISYNDGEQAYMADVEFVAIEDWKKELDILFQDLQNGDDERSRKSAKSDFSIAHAKIKAVYPLLELADILNSSPEKLMQHGSVSNILGTKISFSDDDSTRFYQRLQSYVDSKNIKKGTWGGDKTGETEKVELQDSGAIEMWPLIRVVKLYVKSPALSTGAVIVDLPGTLDSNPARATVAQRYMEQCTGLWIISPITRAVDDKTAQKLLDDCMGRQLKLDCSFNRVSFVCSKTDDIKTMEVQESLDMTAASTILTEKLQTVGERRVSLRKELKLLRLEEDENFGSFNDVLKQIDTLTDALGSLQDDGYTQTDSQKRGAEDDIDPSPSKMPRLCNSENPSSESMRERCREGVGQRPARADGIRQRIKNARELKETISLRRTEIASKIEHAARELIEVDTLERDAETDFRSSCILARNNYTKATVREGFALDIKELDQDLAEERDPSNFDPDTDLRDYDKLARSLPVFCVSSLAYQVLQGRFKGEQCITGFRQLEDTEMPLLQSHCVKLTEAERERNCKQFLNSLDQLLNSLRLWASFIPKSLTDMEHREFKEFLDSRLNELHTNLDSLVEQAYSQFWELLKINILNKMPAACSRAKAMAMGIVGAWNERPRDGGYHWMVYKAICSRSGVYPNNEGPHDWNRDMALPMTKKILHGWEQIFSMQGSTVFSSFAHESGNLLSSFHEGIEGYAEEKGLALDSLKTLRCQLETFHKSFADISRSTTEMMDRKQKIINRSFTNHIQEALADGYSACQLEHGEGHLQRMKDIMTDTVSVARYTMFKETANRIESQLDAMALKMKENMATELRHVKERISSNYEASVAKVGDEGPSSFEIATKTQVLEIIASGEADFRKMMRVDCELRAEGNQKIVKPVNNGEEETMLDSFKNRGIIAEPTGKVKLEEPEGTALSQVAHKDLLPCRPS